MKLADLGWSPFFERQLVPAAAASSLPGRVTGMQRTGVTITLESGEHEVPLGGRWHRGDAESRPAVGDWVLFDRQSGQIDRLLSRKSLLKRVSPGATSRVQVIGANVDALFVVTSCNEEFNPSRLERYLSLAHEGNVRPVLVLTKRDQAESPSRFAEQAATLEAGLDVQLVNALDRSTLDGVAAWCGPGRTVALAGSSGVGKSTLINTLAGADVQATASVRSDRKGRHTTTSRSLHLLPRGGLVLDTPGVRELQVAGAGVAVLFADVEDLARRCRFGDCAHGGEPGCAVRQAVLDGKLDERRLENYLKLRREEAESNSSIAQRRLKR
ncbi:MAG: ribosome small subunit-dependent GTPase A [Gammaproteobacteria bacterium]|nr:ribosome small subunit-dependent GTPase A [Gammaproteobacteria bacterium]